MTVPAPLSRVTSHEPLMKDLILRGAEEGREFAFVLCDSGKGQLHPSRVFKGTASEVDAGMCDQGKGVVGFHTHPGGTPRLSLNDVRLMAARGHQSECIGHLERGLPVVTCFVPDPDDLAGQPWFGGDDLDRPLRYHEEKRTPPSNRRPRLLETLLSPPFPETLEHLPPALRQLVLLKEEVVREMSEAGEIPADLLARFRDRGGRR